MVKFRNIKSGKIVEVTEQVAEQLLRPQGKYEEVKTKEPKPAIKNKSNKKVKNDISRDY